VVESIVILGKVVVVCGATMLVATGFEWFSNIKIEPSNKTIKLGEKNNKREGASHDDKIENMRKRVRSQD